MNIFENILIISLFCLGLDKLLSENMLLNFIRKPFENLTGWKKNLMKPIVLCSVCFSSVWGTLIYISLNGFELANWLICIISATIVIDIVKLIQYKLND